MTEQIQHTTLDSVVQIQYLDDSCARFTEQNGFLSMKATLPGEDGTPTEKSWERVFLHRAFPFDMPEEYISVLDADQKEIGMIRAIGSLSGETQKLLRGELERKYYSPVITKIYSLKERYGFSYWYVELAQHGKFSVTVQDTYRSLIKVTAKHIFLLDVDGNRYEIPDVEALDRASYKRIELYL